MSALAFTILRLGYLVLLWFFLYLIVRVMRRDMADSPRRRLGTSALHGWLRAALRSSPQGSTPQRHPAWSSPRAPWPASTVP